MSAPPAPTSLHGVTTAFLPIRKQRQFSTLPVRHHSSLLRVIQRRDATADLPPLHEPPDVHALQELPDAAPLPDQSAAARGPPRNGEFWFHVRFALGLLWRQEYGWWGYWKQPDVPGV